MTNEQHSWFVIRHLSFVIRHSSFVIRDLSRPPAFVLTSGRFPAKGGILAHPAQVEQSGHAIEHRPYVSPDQEIPEFTLRAIILGSIFGLIFGAVTVYLALRAGLTVSASIPIAVLALAVFKRIGKSTILENNIVQTIGSAGESVAAGVVFTVPALLFLAPNGPAYFNYFQITVLAFAGGILGVLMMVPLRRALIVKEHGVLPY